MSEKNKTKKNLLANSPCTHLTENFYQWFFIYSLQNKYISEIQW